MSTVRVYRADPDFRLGLCPLKFTLSFEGRLSTSTSSGRSKRVHLLRRYFHHQLKRNWERNDFLRNWTKVSDGRIQRYEDWLPEHMPVLEGVKFVPLITKEICVECAIDFKILAPSDFKGGVKDLDNQVKVLFDALKMPQPGSGLSQAELASEGDFLYILAQDDGLITKITATSDELLHPVDGGDHFDSNDVRAFIEVHIRPQMPTSDNVIFYSEDNRIWDHKYHELLGDDLSSLTNNQLKSATTQIIFRLHSLAESFSNWRRASSSNEEGGDHDVQTRIWHENLWPQARSAQFELCKRIYGEPPYPQNVQSMVINSGMLTGPYPVARAAAELETLLRQLN